MRTRSKVMIGTLATLLAGACLLYLALLAALVVMQRRLMYFPAGPAGTASSHGLLEADTLTLRTADGESIQAWYRPPADGRPLYVFFHGNGGTLAIRVPWLRLLSSDGSGFLAIDYRGYGGSTGHPTEAGLLLDGEAAYAEARRLGYDPRRIIIIGESLGSGVAVATAARHPVGALVLDSAFTSTVDIAAAEYWMFPVRLLMKDTFESAARIAGVAAPKLFLHRSGDPIIGVAFGRALFALARPPKTFIEVPGDGHMTLWDPTVTARMKAWVAALPAD